MLSTSPSLDALISEFSRLPGIGRKTAQRLALHVLRRPRAEVEQMAEALLRVKDNVRTCSICCNITEDDPCVICRSDKRSHAVICVVEESNDVFAIERTNEFRGLYHVLGGRLSPLEGIGPDDLHLRELLDRAGSGVEEIILAMNPNVEGEATTLYLSRLLKPMGLRITRIARGIPVGSDLEFTDAATITRAFEGRVAL
ncbi:MAG: recombination mediator RecR [Bacteroidota bacterium]|jgi:recombination protein RecR|nr:recombination mediator RecR [Bacteroidota bacterium]